MKYDCNIFLLKCSERLYYLIVFARVRVPDRFHISLIFI